MIPNKTQKKYLEYAKLNLLEEHPCENNIEELNF